MYASPRSRLSFEFLFRRVYANSASDMMMHVTAIASIGRMIERHRRIAWRTLRADRDVAEQRSEEPEPGTDQREEANALRRFAEEIGRKRARPAL